MTLKCHWQSQMLYLQDPWMRFIVTPMIEFLKAIQCQPVKSLNYTNLFPRRYNQVWYKFKCFEQCISQIWISFSLNTVWLLRGKVQRWKSPSRVWLRHEYCTLRDIKLGMAWLDAILRLPLPGPELKSSWCVHYNGYRTHAPDICIATVDDEILITTCIPLMSTKNSVSGSLTTDVTVISIVIARYRVLPYFRRARPAFPSLIIGRITPNLEF